jgi:hypothetical protein
MNLVEAREQVRSVLNLLDLAGSLGLSLARQKLRAVLQGWPTDRDQELARLSEFERRARNVLGTPYEIRPAGWKDPDGSPHWLRVLDEDAVLKLLQES